MRKYISVFMLASRSTIYKVLAVIAAVGAAQTLLFYRALSGAPDNRLEWVIQNSKITLPAAIGFFLLCAVLATGGCGLGGAKVRYTLGRLALKERTVTLCFALYNACCFAIYWMAQTVIVMALCRVYIMHAQAGLAGPQTVFLAFYRNAFLHSLAPLAEISRYVRNVFFCAALGITSACFAFHYRRGERDITLVLTALTVVAFWGIGMADWAINLPAIILACILPAIAIWRMWGRQGDER